MTSSSLSADPHELLGTWEFDRTIDDRLGPQRLVTGRCELTQADDGRIRWSESGTMRTGDQELPVWRTLFIAPRDGDSWWVTFEDGRDFHPWSTDAPVVHPCAADTYTGQIAIPSTDSWTVIWEVTGPAKDYTMTTHLTRLPGGGHRVSTSARGRTDVAGQ